MPRTVGAKDKQKRKSGVGKKVALGVGAAALGYGAYKVGKFAGTIKRIVDVSENLQKGKADKAYQAYKKGGKDFQQNLRGLLKKGRKAAAEQGQDAAGLAQQKQIRKAMLKEYRRDTGLESAVDAYKAAKKQATQDAKGQPKLIKKVTERQRNKLKDKVKQVGDRRKHVYLSADWSKVYIPRFIK